MSSQEGLSTPQCQGPHRNYEDKRNRAPDVRAFAPTLEHGNDSNHKQDDGGDGKSFHDKPAFLQEQVCHRRKTLRKDTNHA